MIENLTPHRPLADSVGRVVEHAAQGTDQAIKSTQRLANDTLDRLSGGVQRAPAAVRGIAASAEELALRGADALRERSYELRNQARLASQHARERIQHDPLKTVVLAAVIGAGLTALWMWLDRRSTHRMY